MISPKQAKRELEKRQAHTDSRRITDDTDFGPQNDFVNDLSRFIAAQCSRRAGKSSGLAKRFFKTMERYPKQRCIYLGLTRDSAKDIMWPVLQEQNDKYNLGCKFIDSSLTVKHPNGSSLKLYGADMKNIVKRLKGRKAPGIGVDEAQDYSIDLRSLVDDVLTPMIADYTDGWLALTGTPGPVPKGYFYEVTQENQYGFKLHHWTLFENPYMPDPKSFLDDLKVRRKWLDSNPTLLREWRNQWTLDRESLWIRYNSNVSSYESLPQLTAGSYTYVLGVDWGFRDSDALAVIAYSDQSKITYLVEELITPRQDVTSLIENIESLRKKYDISKIVMDEGGGGKKMAEEMRRRHSVPILPADKARKQENVDFLNDALRTGMFKARPDTRFVKDSYLVQINWDKSTPNKIVIKDNPHSDIIDAVLYAYKASMSYLYEKPKDKPKKNTKEYYDAEAVRLEAAAEEYFEKLEQAEKYWK